MENVIEHIGVVVDILSFDKVRVRIEQDAACGGCQARSRCMAVERKEKIIDCVTADKLEIGEQVKVMISQRAGWLAILLAFVCPLILMSVVLFTLRLYLSESLAGSLSLCSLAFYYLVLWQFNSKVEKEFDFIAKKIDK